MASIWITTLDHAGVDAAVRGWLSRDALPGREIERATPARSPGTGEPGFYGFAMARQIRDASAARQLTAHGTLYKALARLEQAGMLTSSWEDPGLAEAERRPRRRLYRVTPSGVQAVLRSTGQRASTASRPGLGLAPA
jgi:PadR family transcriptional regulator, regulatory protein PadR